MLNLILAFGLVMFLVAAGLMVLGMCRAAGEADDRADEYGERYLWSDK